MSTRSAAPRGDSGWAVFASLSAVIAMASFGAHPLWSAAIIIADLLVIYGLAVDGDDYA